jgi:thiamine biosynthesis lipoprotein
MRFGAYAALAGTLLAACHGDGERFYEQRLLAMGTWVDVTIEVPEDDARTQLLGEIESLLLAFERDYYAWADGELAHFNAAIELRQPVSVSPDFARLLLAAQRLSKSSDGAFEPAVGALVELWGFHDASSAASDPPDPASIEQWRILAPSVRNLSIGTDGVVRATGNVSMLDLGGIAKGEAVDRILRLLRKYGVANALVNAGGDLRVLGSRGDHRWRIGIQAPRAPGLLGIIELADGEAAFTSGDYERYYEFEGGRMHHILDPSTGYPVSHTQAVTVIANDGVTADAAATALLVAGPDTWREMAAALGITMALRVDASGRIEATAQMRERLQPDDAAGSDILIVGP